MADSAVASRLLTTTANGATAAEPPVTSASAADVVTAAVASLPVPRARTCEEIVKTQPPDDDPLVPSTNDEVSK